MTVAVVAPIGASAVLAEPQLLDPKRLQYNDCGRWEGFESRPAREIMTTRELGRYRQALDQLQCTAASTILNSAFIRRYPKFGRARMKPDCLRDPDCRHWKDYAERRFENLGMCRIVARFNYAEQTMRDWSVTPPKYAMKPPPAETIYESSLVQFRDLALQRLIGQSSLGSVPALVKLAELVRRADLFNANGDVEYYLLIRACYFASSCDRFRPRLKQLRGAMSSTRAIQLERKARTQDFLKVDLNQVMLDGKL